MTTIALEQMLLDIGNEGGRLDTTEASYWPVDEEAAELRLIKIRDAGNGVTRKLTFTNLGRQWMGIPVITPPTTRCLTTRLAGLIPQILKPTR